MWESLFPHLRPPHWPHHYTCRCWAFVLVLRCCQIVAPFVMQDVPTWNPTYPKHNEKDCQQTHTPNVCLFWDVMGSMLAPFVPFMGPLGSRLFPPLGDRNEIFWTDGRRGGSCWWFPLGERFAGQETWSHVKLLFALRGTLICCTCSVSRQGWGRMSSNCFPAPRAHICCTCFVFHAKGGRMSSYCWRIIC